MSRRVSAWLAWSLVALSVALFGGGISLSWTVRSTVPALPYGSRAEPGAAIITLATVLTFSVVGAIIASRHPRNIIGWLYCSMGLGVGLSTLAAGYAEYWLASGSGIRSLAETAAWFSSWFWIILVLPTVLLLLLFPDGRLPSRRWRLVAWSAMLGIIGFASGSALQTGPLEDFPQIVNPYGLDSPIVQIVGVVGGIMSVCSMVASAVSVIVRMRRAGSEERQQIKWLAYGGAVVFGTEIFVAGLVSLWSVNISIVISSLAWLGLPVFTGIAIVKHRLYDIDVVVNRSLVYGSLTATLFALYFGVVTATQAMFHTLTGQERLPQLVVVASTLAIAALFNPLRRRIQAVVDRRFYRNKYDAARTLEVFSARLRDETDLGTLGDDLVGMVRETMRPEHVSLWLRPDTTSKVQQLKEGRQR